MATVGPSTGLTCFAYSPSNDYTKNSTNPSSRIYYAIAVGEPKAPIIMLTYDTTTRWYQGSSYPTAKVIPVDVGYRVGDLYDVAARISDAGRTANAWPTLTVVAVGASGFSFVPSAAGGSFGANASGILIMNQVLLIMARLFPNRAL